MQLSIKLMQLSPPLSLASPPLSPVRELTTYLRHPQMAALQAQSLFFSSSTTSSMFSGRRVRAGYRLPCSLLRAKAMPRSELPQQTGEQTTAASDGQPRRKAPNEPLLSSKLYAVLEAAADRAEMHAIIGAQRNNWNHLLTSSINTISLTASIMAGISSIPVGTEASPHLLAFKLSSALLFAAATGMMTIINKIQPSQLAEEQRKAMSLWKQLETSIETTLALRAPTEQDVQEAMEKVLALDKAYPLPLLPGMLEKFPKVVEPARWWPKRHRRESATMHAKSAGNDADMNGWSKELEDEMKGALRALKVKDEEQFVTFGMLLLKINKSLAFLGPLFAGVAAVGTILIGVQALGSLPTLFAVLGGVLATLSNTLEHSGQVGMVFELSRNCAGFYRQLEEEIESTLKESDVRKRENGDLFKMKAALRLGRSLPELKDLASYASSSCTDEDIKEPAGKLF